MERTEVVHTRVSPEIKEKAENIFKSIGLTTSQAISLFLIAAVNYNGIPFDLVKRTKEDEDISFASSVAKVDGIAPSKQAEGIMRRFSRGEIDYETAQKELERKYTQK